MEMFSQEALKQAKENLPKRMNSMGCSSGMIPQERSKRKLENPVRRQKLEESNEARGQNIPPTTSSLRSGLLSGTCLRLESIYTNAEGLMVKGKELEFKEQGRQS